jgi:hypothetical protein
MALTHRHHGADRVVTGSKAHASADMNVTPLIDVLHGDPAPDAEGPGRKLAPG